MTTHGRVLTTLIAGVLGIVGVGFAASVAGADPPDGLTRVDGTIWVANRGAHTIRGFDAATGQQVAEWPMAPLSQPGDLAYARGKLYVAEEFPPPPLASGQPGIAIVDPDSGAVVKRIPIGPAQPAASHRPHHVHASPDGRLVAFGLYGTDNVAVVDTRTDTLLEPPVPDPSGQKGFDTNPLGESGRAHAGVFSPNGKTLYVASDATNEIVALDPRTGDNFWRLNVPGAHEIAVTRNGKTAFVSRRTLNRVAAVDLVNRTWADVPDISKPGFALELGLPDTLKLARNDRLLTISLRVSAQVVVFNTRTFENELVQIGPLAGIAGHQWTSPNGRYTFAAFEVGANAGAASGVAVIDHRDGNKVLEDLLEYPGRPHGVDLEPESDDEDEDEDEDDDD